MLPTALMPQSRRVKLGNLMLLLPLLAAISG
jgi:hypothetical protein